MIRVYLLPLLAIAGAIFAVRTVLLGSAPSVVAAPVVAAAVAPFERFVTAAGIVEARSENIAIAVPVGGVVSTVAVTVGARVNAGDVLLRLDDRVVGATAASARAAAKAAQAEAEEAARRLRRFEEMKDKRSVSVEEYEKIRYGATAAAARLEQAEAEAQRAQFALDERTVRAPIAAEVLQVKIRPGEFASAQALNQPLMVLGATDTLHVRADIDESDAWRVRPGAKAFGYLRGKTTDGAPLKFIRFEPYVVPKRSLTGESTERVDTRVLQVIFEIQPTAAGTKLPVYVGQLIDVFIEEQPD